MMDAFWAWRLPIDIGALAYEYHVFCKHMPASPVPVFPKAETMETATMLNSLMQSEHALHIL